MPNRAPSNSSRAFDRSKPRCFAQQIRFCMQCQDVINALFHKVRFVTILSSLIASGCFCGAANVAIVHHGRAEHIAMRTQVGHVSYVLLSVFFVLCAPTSSVSLLLVHCRLLLLLLLVLLRIQHVFGAKGVFDRNDGGDLAAVLCQSQTVVDVIDNLQHNIRRQIQRRQRAAQLEEWSAALAPLGSRVALQQRPTAVTQMDVSRHEIAP